MYFKDCVLDSQLSQYDQQQNILHIRTDARSVKWDSTARILLITALKLPQTTETSLDAEALTFGRLTSILRMLTFDARFHFGVPLSS